MHFIWKHVRGSIAQVMTRMKEDIYVFINMRSCTQTASASVSIVLQTGASHLQLPPDFSLSHMLALGEVLKIDKRIKSLGIYESVCSLSTYKLLTYPLQTSTSVIYTLLGALLCERYWSATIPLLQLISLTMESTMWG